MEFSMDYIKSLRLDIDIENVERKFSQSRNLDEFCNSLMDDLVYPDNEKLAVKLLMQRQHTDINVSDNVDENILNFVLTLEDLNEAKVVPKNFLSKVRSKLTAIDRIRHENDFDYSYIAFIMMMKGYFCKIRDLVLECPQFMFLRVAFQLHDDEDLIRETYHLLSERSIIHASPTLFNSGTRNPQLSSCFLVCLKDDSINGIYKTLAECANISKHGGGIGLSLSNLRSKYSYIESSQNQCKGIKPVLDGLEHCAQYVDQGGRRKGAICVYFEMTHPEIPEVLVYKRNVSRENINYEHKIRDLFLGLWVPDLFMERVKSNGKWSFFDKKYQKELTEIYGDEYTERYLELERQEEYVRQVDALGLFNEIIKTQIETGGPFICYKDTANMLSNQKNVGTIKSSNLCTEIFEFSSEDQTAVCNLASINLEKCVLNKSVDYDKIGNLTRILTRNLNCTIDKNFYCSDYSKKNNLELRPIGIGVTGLQGLFFQLNLPLTSPEARKINSKIFEVMYFNALKESNKMAKQRTNRLVKYAMQIPLVKNYVKRYSGCYPKFWGSPLSQGKTHIELYEELTNRKVNRSIEEREWTELKESIKLYGVCNSLFIALMPTVSTSELVNATDCFEPVSEAIVYKNNQHGNFKLVNQHFRRLLIDKNRWNRETIDSIIGKNGSVQHLPFLSDYEKLVYRLSWEIDPKEYITLAIDRAPFIDQGQSLSWFIENPGSDIKKLGQYHFFTWSNRLKTGMYYLRQRAVSQTSDFKKLDEDLKHCLSCS
jgi:ribonucleoside-diphosphate reductase alpha chain